MIPSSIRKQRLRQSSNQQNFRQAPPFRLMQQELNRLQGYLKTFQNSNKFTWVFNKGEIFWGNLIQRDPERYRVLLLQIRKLSKRYSLRFVKRVQNDRFWQ